jgi:hypothetical protein
MAKFVTSKYRAAERLYPAMPMQNAQTVRATRSCRDRESRLDRTEGGPMFRPESTL